MSSFWNFVFGAILIITWIIAGGFVSQANTLLRPFQDRDNDLQRAYTFTFWAAFVTWFLVVLFILLIILSILGFVALFGSGVGEAGAAAEEAETTESLAYRNIYSNPSITETGISWFTIGFLIFALILIGITGVLSAIAASSIANSPHYNPSVNDLKKAYDNCIIAASLSLGIGGLLIIGIIIYFVVGYERQKAIDAQRQRELAQIQEIKQEAFRERVVQQAAFRQRLQSAEEQALINRVSQRQ